MANPKSERFPVRPYYALTDHPDHARALGEIAAAWSLVEHQLVAIFTFLLRAPMTRAHSAYYAIVNNNARIDMMRAIIADSSVNKQDAKHLTTLLTRTRRVANKRNGYIHKLWLEFGGQVYCGEDLANTFPAGKKRKVHPKEMEKTREEILDVAHDLGVYIKEASEKDPMQVRVKDLPPSWNGKFPLP